MAALADGLPSAVTPGPQARGRVPGVPRPSSTAISFLLLVALLVLTGAFLGNWLWISSYDGPGLAVQPPVLWLVLPPLLILATTTVVVLLEPRIVVRRRGLVPVPAGLPAAARFTVLVAEAGLRHAPLLVHNPEDGGTSARSVGRPGHHLVVVSPAILGAARRRKGVFDVILRHELAQSGLATSRSPPSPSVRGK